jgi:hypothetical protein
MGELYWMAAARDVPFVSYGSDATVAAAVGSLNGEFPRFGGTLPVTAQNVFRGIYPGEQVGPYVSQFLLKGNVDPRKPSGQGRDAADGFISYGARNIDQRLFSATPGGGLPDGLSHPGPDRNPRSYGSSAVRIVSRGLRQFMLPSRPLRPRPGCTGQAL